MKYKSLLVCSLLLFLVIFSCTSVDIQSDGKLVSDESLREINPAFIAHDLSVYQIKPLWKTAIVYNNLPAYNKTKINQQVEVNFTQNNATIYPLSPNRKNRGCQRLHLKFDNEKIIETIIEYIPSDNFLIDINDINAGNFFAKQFDGEITFKDPKDDFKYVWYLSKGKIMKRGKRFKNKT